MVKLTRSDKPIILATPLEVSKGILRSEIGEKIPINKTNFVFERKSEKFFE